MLGRISTGAQNDLERVTKMAYSQASDLWYCASAACATALRAGAQGMCWLTRCRCRACKPAHLPPCTLAPMVSEDSLTLHMALHVTSPGGHLRHEPQDRPAVLPARGEPAAQAVQVGGCVGACVAAGGCCAWCHAPCIAVPLQWSLQNVAVVSWRPNRTPACSDDTARLIDGEVRSLVDAAYQRTVQVGALSPERFQSGKPQVGMGTGLCRSAQALPTCLGACQSTARPAAGPAPTHPH